jgi:cell division protein ZapA
MAPGQIRVNIFGADYSLMSDNDEAFVKEIARYIDDKMREIDKNQTVKSSSRIAVLAALNIAEELFQERLYREKLLDQLNEEARKINQNIADVLEE